MIDGRPRLLIVRLGAFGDVVHAIPVAAALRRRHPHARIDWVVDARYVDLVRLVLGVDRAVPIDTRRMPGTLPATFRALRSAGYDAAIDVQGLVKSAALARLAVPRRVIGFPRSHLREPLARLFYTDTHDPGGARHVIRQNLALLAALGVHDGDVTFELSVPANAAAAALEQRHGAGGYVLLNPGAAWPNKRWPAVRFGALAAGLLERLGLRSVVLWGEGEEALASEVVQASKGAADVAPPTSVVDLLGVSKGAALMVSGDTGPLHLAGAVSTPIVALFGPTDPERNGPWSDGDVTVSRYPQCICHYERRCRRAIGCIDDITVGEVLAAAERRVALGKAQGLSRQDDSQNH